MSAQLQHIYNRLIHNQSLSISWLTSIFFIVSFNFALYMAMLLPSPLQQNLILLVSSSPFYVFGFSSCFLISLRFLSSQLLYHHHGFAFPLFESPQLHRRQRIHAFSSFYACSTVGSCENPITLEILSNNSSIFFDTLVGGVDESEILLRSWYKNPERLSPILPPRAFSIFFSFPISFQTSESTMTGIPRFCNRSNPYLNSFWQ